MQLPYENLTWVVMGESAKGTTVPADPQTTESPTNRVAAELLENDKAIRDQMEDIQTALDGLLYVSPAVVSFTNSRGNVMVGTTLSSVALAFTFNKQMASVSLNQGIGGINPDWTAYTHNATITSSRTYTITIGDGTNSATANTSITFLPPRFYGVSSQGTLDNAAVQALSTDLSNSRAQSRNMTAAGQYLWFAWPVSSGLVTGITVNGLANTAWTVSQLSFTNLVGYVQDYYLYRSNEILTGTYAIVVT